jgi:hypothetical protein
LPYLVICYFREDLYGRRLGFAHKPAYFNNRRNRECSIRKAFWNLLIREPYSFSYPSMQEVLSFILICSFMFVTDTLNQFHIIYFKCHANSWSLVVSSFIYFFGNLLVSISNILGENHRSKLDQK